MKTRLLIIIGFVMSGSILLFGDSAYAVPQNLDSFGNMNNYISPLK